MSFKRFPKLFHHINKSLKHKHTFHNHHQQHFLFTSSNFNFKSHHRTHTFRTPYSNQIHLHKLYSHFLNLIHTHCSPFTHHKHTTHPYLHYLHSLKRFASMDVSKDYYQILSINKNATKKEIRASYLKLAKQWHPDLHKDDKDKKKARDKFIQFQEAYEVLHDDGMRKKYDEMRRYGISQDQYKYQEAYQKQTGQSPFTNKNRSANPYENAWEQEFRRNMQSEWEKIRREQFEWASQRRQERHGPFGHQSNQNYGGNPFGGTPFGTDTGQNPFSDPKFKMVHNPLEGFFRTMIYVFAFFMAFRLIGFMLFGPPKDGRFRNDGHSPYQNGPGRKGRGESPFYNRDRYDRYNQNFPPPLSLREKEYKDKELKREPYRPEMPNSPKPRNSLRDNERRDSEDIVFGDGNKGKGKQVRGAKKSKYERMLEEQRMMEEVYIRARQKQREEKEFERQRDMHRKFGNKAGRKPPPPPVGSGYDEDKEDVNEAWERYLNSNSRRSGSWRDRNRRNG